MSACLQASFGPPPVAKVVDKPEIVRWNAEYHPSVWDDYFLAYDTPNYIPRSDSETEGKIQQLKDVVKKKLLEAADNPQQQMKLIDDIQRLGVAYHFETEIDLALNHMKDAYTQLCSTETADEEDELHYVALCFRLLRQHGYNVSSDVFKKFKDSKGEFKKFLSKDVHGMLSLYEAAHLRVHGEDILEEALVFTTFNLDQYLKSTISSTTDNTLYNQIKHAFKVPIWRGMNRAEARYYMSLYSEDDSSHGKALLSLAKLDFQLLQKLHQKELGTISRWWKDLNFKEKLPFARDRLVECYFWAVGVYFEPEYALARSILTKIFVMMIVMDDMYDVYGTLEELLIFTDALQRWDISALDQLPEEYLKIFYQAVLDLYHEIEEALVQAGIPSYRHQYSKDTLKQTSRAYLYEAKCLNNGYTPTMEEYMSNALITAALIFLGASSFVGMGDLVTKEALDWAFNFPPLLRAGSVFCRLTDDMIEHDDKEKKTEDVGAVDCYMKEHGVAKEEACDEFKKQIVNAWKDMNVECLNPTAAAAIPRPLVIRAFNMVRVTNLIYTGIDGFTTSETRTKNLISSVLVDSPSTNMNLELF